MRVKCTTFLEITKSVGSVTSSFVSQIAGYKCIPGYIGQLSHFHTSKWCRRWNTPSAEMRIAKITRDQGLPHRNDISLNKPLFFRKGRNLEAWKERLKPKKLIYEKETTVNETPQDDVYLRHLYKPQVLSIKDSVKTLKEYTELDYTDQESIVTLKLGLIENYVGKGGRKRIVTFFDTTELPHPGGIPNKVCLFTDMEEAAELAIDNGAVDAGGAELIHKVLCDQVVCDAYLSTVTFHDKVVLPHKELYEKLGKLKPSRNWGSNDDFLEHLKNLVTKTIYHNFSDGLQCTVKIGRAKQSVDELTSNIEHLIDVMSSKIRVSKKKGAKHKNLIEKASISCNTEDIPMDIASILPKDPESESESN